MSTIDEDSRELSTTDNPTSHRSATDDYVDVTGLSSSPPDKALTRKHESKYVTEDEWQAATSGERKRRRRLMKRRLESKSRGPELFDPLAGLEIYGVEGKRKKRRRLEDEPRVVEEVATKTETDVSESETEKLDEPKSSAETKEKSAEEKRDSATETSGTESQSSGRKRCRGRGAIYREYRRRGKRQRKDECRRRRRSRRSRSRRRRRKVRDEEGPRKDEEKSRVTSSPDSADTSTQHRTEPGRSCASQAQPEEWLRDEQRRLWEQMCAKMAEYSHRFGYPEGFCQPASYFPYSGCDVPMYDPQQFRPRFQGHLCPRYVFI